MMRFQVFSIHLWFWMGLIGISGCTALKQNTMENTLKPALASVLSAHPEATVGVSVVDLRNGETFDWQGDVPMHAASTMKVPVMIEAFRQVQTGKLRLEEPVLLKNEFRSIVDGSLFSIGDDSDDQTYRELGQTKTVRELIFQMITVSSNLATNLLIDRLGAAQVQSTIEQMGTRRMKVRRGVEDLKAFDLGLNNEATAHDLALLLAALAQRRATTPELDAEMIEILKAQRFNEMIPQGVPAGTIVAHKTGEITAHRHDAAIVYPQNGKPFVLVILIKGISDSDQAYALGQSITRLVYQTLRGS